MTNIGVYLTSPTAIKPTRATADSACWDVSACLVDGTRVQTLDQFNEQHNRLIEDGKLCIFAGERALVPTGCIFDIPQGWSLRLHPRSGLAWKRGVSLANCEGVIDSDYVNETYVAVFNHSGLPFVVNHGDRIAQVELVPVKIPEFTTLEEPPGNKTQRNGGFGSTGVES